MTRDKIIFLILGLIVGGMVGFWAGQTREQALGDFKTENVSTMEQNSNTLDAHFIEQMIPHHEDAITMANIALAKAKTNEVRSLAQEIIDSQGKEIAMMKEWYKKWYNKEVPDNNLVMAGHGMMGHGNGMHMGVTGDETDLTRLEQAEDFDSEFVRQMIPHHQMAVMMANMLKNGTKREEMKTLAEDIIEAQSREIEQMRGWIQEWSN